MSKQKKLITFTDPEGVDFMRLCADAYVMSELEEEGAQRLNRYGDQLYLGLQKLIADLSDPEIEPWTYPLEYTGPKPIREQVDLLAQLFSLSLDGTIEYIETTLPALTLPEGAEGWFAIPRWEKLGSEYGKAVDTVLSTISSKRKFHDADNARHWYIRQNVRTASAFKKLGDEQDSDILIVPCQFGLRHRGRSVWCARDAFVDNEFGLGAFAVGCMLLTHLERFAPGRVLNLDCAGDECDTVGPHPIFKYHAPSFYWKDGMLNMIRTHCSPNNERFGSASAFLPQ